MSKCHWNKKVRLFGPFCVTFKRRFHKKARSNFDLKTLTECGDICAGAFGMAAYYRVRHLKWNTHIIYETLN